MEGDVKMPYLEKEEFMLRLKERMGEDLSDESIAFIEDASDTYDKLSKKTTDTEDWKAKYEENDRTWRERYRERFFSPTQSKEEMEEAKEEQNEDVKHDGEKRSYDDLFEEREG